MPWWWCVMDVSALCLAVVWWAGRHCVSVSGYTRMSARRSHLHHFSGMSHTEHWSSNAERPNTQLAKSSGWDSWQTYTYYTTRKISSANMEIYSDITRFNNWLNSCVSVCGYRRLLTVERGWINCGKLIISLIYFFPRLVKISSRNEQLPVSIIYIINASTSFFNIIPTFAQSSSYENISNYWRSESR